MIPTVKAPNPDSNPSPALFAAVVECWSDAIVVQHLHGHILSWNRAAEALLGYGKTTVLGQPLAPFVSLEDPTAIPFFSQPPQPSPSFPQPAYCGCGVGYHQDGSSIPLSVTALRVDDGDGTTMAIAYTLRVLDSESSIQPVTEKEGEGRSGCYPGRQTPTVSDPPSKTVSQHRETWHQATLTAIPDLIYRVNRDGLYLGYFPGVDVVDYLSENETPVGRSLMTATPHSTVDDHALTLLRARQQQALQSVLDSGMSEVFEQSFAIDGHIQYEEVRVVPLDGDEALFIVRNINDRKRLALEQEQSALALQTSESQLRSILNAIPDLLYVVDADGIYRQLIQPNPAIDALIHLDSPVGMQIYDILPTDIAKRHMAAIQDTLQTGDLHVYEQQIRIGDRLQDEEVRIVKRGDDDALLMIRDIGDRKTLEMELRDSEAQNRAMLEAIPDLMYRVSNDGTFLGYFSSPDVFDFFPDYKQAIGKPLLFYPPGTRIDRETFERLRAIQLVALDAVLKTRTRQMYEQDFDIQGQRIWEEIRAVPCGPNEVLFIIRDISDRKQAELDRQVAQTRLQDAQRIAHLGNWEFNHQTGTVYWSDEIFRIFERSPQQFTPTFSQLLQMIHPDDRDTVAAAFEHHATQRVPYNITYRLLLPSGITKYVHDQCETSYQDDIALVSQGILQDVTAQKQAEVALQSLLEATAATTEQDFFPALVIHMAQALQVAHAVVSEWTGDQLETIALCSHGVLQPNISYYLTNTPCQYTLERGMFYCEQSVQQEFPDDLDLVHLEAESYLGIALRSSTGQPIGNLCILDTKPLHNPHQAEQILRVFAARASVELERQRTRLQLEQLNRSLEAKVDERTATLQERERQIRSMIAAIPDLLLRVTQDGHCIECIHAQQPGDGSCQMIKHHISEVLPPDLLARQLQAIAKVLSTGKRQIYEHQLFKGDRLIFEEIRIVAISPQEALIMVRDVTDRKRVEASLRKSEATNRALLSAIPDFMARITADGVQTEVINTGATGGLGPTPSSGSSCAVRLADILPSDLVQERMRLIHRALKTGTVQQHEYTLVHQGRVTYEEARISPLWSREVLVVVRNITERKQAENNLRQSRQFLQTVLDTFPLAVFWKDRNSVYLGSNQNFLNHAGLGSTVELIGKTDEDMPWGHHEAESYRADDQEVIQSESAKLGIVHLKSLANGNQIWVETNKLPLRDLEGHVVGVLATYQDITARKLANERLQEASTRLELAAQSAGIGIWEWSLAENRLIWDDRMYDLYGLSRHTTHNLHDAWVAAIHPDDHHAAVITRRIPTLHVNTNALFRIIRPDGTIRFIQASAIVQPNEAGHPQRIIGINYDVTKEKEATAQLQQTNAELARATRLKDEFLANMSHELRTPLNAILGMTEVLRDGTFGDCNDRQRRALNTIELGGTHLLELINDILDVAKIEAGQIILERTPTAVTCLCQSSVMFVKQMLQRKRIKLSLNITENLPYLYVDERRIRQVLLNLLNNAVKFTPKEGQISVTVDRASVAALPSVSLPDGFSSPDGPSLPHKSQASTKALSPTASPQPTQPEMLAIAIADTGIGIAPEMMSKLFQPFTQIDSALNRQYSGTGLGLTIVKRIVDLHGGEVTVTSTLGQGSCFTITLPCLDDPTAGLRPPLTDPETAPSQTLPFQGESALILIAEDNEANICTVSNYLNAKGFETIVAKNGAEAIALVRSATPHLVLMDIQMPDMDGLSAIRQIRADATCNDIPIIALTALAMDGDRDRCLAAGADDYCSKPVKLGQLARMIYRHLSRSTPSVPPTP